MLNNISWHSFITFIVITAIVYYVTIGVLYFRGDIMRLLKEGWKRNKVPEHSDGTSRAELFSSTHELMAELKDLFFTASDQQYPKEELIMALQTKLKAYSRLKNTNLEKAVQDHIVQSAVSVCSIDLDDSDMKRIW